MNKHKRKPIPPADTKVRNLDEGPPVWQSNGYTAQEWHPERDGKGRPTAVVLVNHLNIDGTNVDIGMRIKSRAECERLITILGSHMNHVWPEIAS